MSGRNNQETNGITLLGNEGTKYEMSYNPAILESFVNKHLENDYFVKFNCPEFTSLCPITGQPDFATITIFTRVTGYSGTLSSSNQLTRLPTTSISLYNTELRLDDQFAVT